jgi:hypothetical protein
MFSPHNEQTIEQWLPRDLLMKREQMIFFDSTLEGLFSRTESRDRFFYIRHFSEKEGFVERKKLIEKDRIKCFNSEMK